MNEDSSAGVSAPARDPGGLKRPAEKARRMRAIDSSRLGFQSVALTLATAVSQVLVGIMYLLAARALAPSEFGSVASAIALGGSIAGLVDFGSNSLWVREGAAGRLSVEETAVRALTKVLVGAIAAGGAGLAFAVAGGALSALLACAITISTIITQAVYVGLRRLHRSASVALCMVLDRTVAFSAYLVLSTRAAQGLALGLALVLGAITSVGVAYAVTPRGARLWPSRFAVANPWRGTSGYGLSSLAASIQSLELQAIAVWGGSGAVGNYASVSRWTQPLGLMAGAFSTAAMPFVASARSWRASWIAVRGVSWLPSLSVAGALLAVPLAPHVVPILLGDGYPGSAEVLQALAIGTVGGVLNQVLAMFLQARGFDRIVARALLTMAVFQLASVAVASSLLGAPGAAWASAGCQFAVAGWLALMMTRAGSRRSLSGRPAAQAGGEHDQ